MFFYFPLCPEPFVYNISDLCSLPEQYRLPIIICLFVANDNPLRDIWNGLTAGQAIYANWLSKYSSSEPTPIE